MKKIFLSILLLINIGALNAQIITTIAGDGTSGFSGDGGMATIAKFNGVAGIGTDNIGNIYIADEYNNRIRKIDVSGNISTIAGNGTFGYSGDGSSATAARLGQPFGVTVDNAGNIYIADNVNGRIRKINYAGVITSIAGGGSSLLENIPATSALLSNPTSVATNVAGDVYFIEGNNGVREIVPTGYIHTYAGYDIVSGYTGYSGDGGPATSAEIGLDYNIAVDNIGNLFIADYTNNRIRKVNTAGIITTIAGMGTPGYSGDGGSATAAQLSGPYGIAVDGSGNIFISEQFNNCIRKISASGIITTIAGNGMAGFTGDNSVATSAELNSPGSIAVDINGNILIADRGNQRIRKIYNGQPPLFIWGHYQNISICENATATSIDSLLGISDLDTGQTESWSTIVSPLHGSLVTAATIMSTGDTLIPTSLTYTPSSSYVGIDSFKVRIFDGILSDTTMVIVTINPLPNPGTIAALSNVCLGNSITLSESVGGGTWSVSNSCVAIITGTITGINVGIDTINYTVTNTCGTVIAMTTVTVDSLAVPTISATPSVTSVCAGSSINFTSAITNGGTSPTYQWRVNTTNTGTSSTYSYVPTSGDVIECTLVSNAACVSTPTVTSTPVTVTVTPTVTPTIAISPSATTVCAGAAVSYTSAITNGGASPAYQWKVNGSNVGTGTGYSYSPVNGDMVKCTLVSNATCAMTPTVTSTAVTMTVNPLPAPYTIGGSGTYATTGNITLSGSQSGVSYQLSDGSTGVAGTGSSLNFPATTSGTYFIVATNTTTGCTDTMNGTAVIVIDPTTGVSEIGNNTSIIIFPNPAKDQIEVSGTIIDRVQIMDMAGKLLVDHTYHSAKAMVDISSLAAGVYFVKVNERTIQKIGK